MDPVAGLVERLRDMASWYPAQPPKEVNANLLLYEAASVLTDLASRLAIAERDAERYRWLAEKPSARMGLEWLGMKADVDEEVDAAMKESGNV